MFNKFLTIFSFYHDDTEIHIWLNCTFQFNCNPPGSVKTTWVIYILVYIICLKYYFYKRLQKDLQNFTYIYFKNFESSLDLILCGSDYNLLLNLTLAFLPICLNASFNFFPDSKKSFRVGTSFFNPEHDYL